MQSVIAISVISASLLILSALIYLAFWIPNDNALLASPSDAELIISNFQPGHGFIKQSAAGTQLDNSNDFVLGKQSLKLVTNGNGSPVFTRKSSISPSIDFNSRILKLWIKVNDISRVSELRVTITGDNFASYENYWIHGTNKNANASFLRNDAWNIMTISPTQTTSVGLPSLSQINTIQIRVVDKGNGPVEVSFNGLSLVAKNDRGIVSFAFDDGYDDTYTIARPILDKYHFPATAYITTAKIGTAGRMTVDQLKKLQDLNGWDISSHTVDHLDLTTLSRTDIETQLASSKQFLLDNGLHKGSDHFAYPYGSFDNDDLKQLVQKYYKTARTTKGATETLPPGDPYRLRVIIVNNATATDAISARVQASTANGDWLIIVFHRIVDSNSNAETKYLRADFETIVDDIRSRGVEVMTVSDVYDGRYH